MPYIIDGNNLIGSAPDFSLGDPEARGRMVSTIKKFQESKNTKVTVVFDGEPQGSERHNPINAKMQVIYPRYGQSADDEIKRILEGYRHVKETILVTTDRELKTFAKEMGVRTINSIEFYYLLKKNSVSYGKKEETLKRVNARVSQNEVEQWLKIFSDS
ncbi:MAG: NYN domain-containing protein [Acidobacteria bacterium]|jgi:predicted RNA-binding protein with PIN domain|nr:NYN domain-containing protein [Acidobacteriota bacterium]